MDGVRYAVTRGRVLLLLLCCSARDTAGEESMRCRDERSSEATRWNVRVDTAIV